MGGCGGGGGVGCVCEGGGEDKGSQLHEIPPSRPTLIEACARTIEDGTRGGDERRTTALALHDTTPRSHPTHLEPGDVDPGLGQLLSAALEFCEGEGLPGAVLLRHGRGLRGKKRGE